MMDKNLKDFLPLYLGCDVVANYQDEENVRGILTGIHGEYGAEIQFFQDGNALEHPEYDNYETIKPILRKLEDMSEEENEDWFDAANDITGIENEIAMLKEAERSRYLLSKHYDLFNLIESGLAIDAKTIKQ